MDWTIFMLVFTIFITTAYVANRLHCSNPVRNSNKLM